MGSPLYLTLLAGPVEAVPVPKPVIDALTSVEVTESATGRSGFQLTFTLGDTIPFCKPSSCSRRSRRFRPAGHSPCELRRTSSSHHGWHHPAP